MTFNYHSWTSAFGTLFRSKTTMLLEACNGLNNFSLNLPPTIGHLVGAILPYFAKLSTEVQTGQGMA